jgi:hypothetical protein
MDDPNGARRVRNAIQDVEDIVRVGLESLGKGKIRLPNDYQYDNANPGEELHAKTIFGLATELDENLTVYGKKYSAWH